MATITLRIPDEKYQRILEAFDKLYPGIDTPSTKLENRIKELVVKETLTQERRDTIEATTFQELEL